VTASHDFGNEHGPGYNAAMRYRLRTLMILLATLPPLLGIGHIRWQRYRERQGSLGIIHVPAMDPAALALDFGAAQAAAPPPPPADDSNQNTIGSP